jgi:hypothetical protein
MKSDLDALTVDNDKKFLIALCSVISTSCCLLTSPDPWGESVLPVYPFPVGIVQSAKEVYLLYGVLVDTSLRPRLPKYNSDPSKKESNPEHPCPVRHSSIFLARLTIWASGFFLLPGISPQVTDVSHFRLFVSLTISEMATSSDSSGP